MIDAPSIEAVELYSVALRTIVLAGFYRPEEIGWAVAKLRSEQGRYTRSDGDWQGYEHLINAILAVAMEGRDEIPTKSMVG